MKNSYTLLLVLFNSLSFAQNWNLLDQNKTYFYKHIDSLYITNTIKVDSVVASGSDFDYFVHTTIKICDTCTIIPSDAAGGIMYHAFAPELFGLTPMYSNSNEQFVFIDGTIKHKAELFETWTFNSTTSINATLADKYETTFLGMTDSFKVIQLSTLDTIIISKNHGVIRYPDFENPGKYYLQAGYHEGQNSFGEYLPNARTIYDFVIGDEFCYSSGLWDSGFALESVIGSLKFKILADNSTIDSISYQLKYYHEESHSYFGPNFEDNWYPSYGTAGNELLNFKIKNDPQYVENTYGIFNADIFDGDQFYFPVWTIPFANYYCNDIAGYEIGFIDFIYSNYFGYIKRVRTYVLTDDSLCYFPQQNLDQDRKFANGFGSIDYSYFCFETGYDHNMTAFVKNGDTLDGICYFPEDLSIDPSQPDKLFFYPNPAKDIIHVPGNLNSLVIYNQLGSQVLRIENPDKIVSLTELPAGIYVIHGSDQNGNHLLNKLIIE